MLIKMLKGAIPFAALAFLPAANATVQVANLTRLWTATNASYGDNFYSVTESIVDSAISCCGYTNKAVVGFMEPTLDDSTTALFHRTFGGPPYIDHFYTTRIADYNYALSVGYTDEGSEGVLRSTAAFTGSLPLYRLSHYTPGTGDVEHWYGLSSTQRASFIASGWYDEGIEGYMWPSPDANADIQGSGSAVAGGYVVSGTTGYVRVPGILESGANVETCGGELRVYIDGTFTQAYTTSSYAYDVLPGSSNMYGCFARWAARQGTHTYRFEFSGYRFRSDTTGQFGIFAPYTSEVTATY